MASITLRQVKTVDSGGTYTLVSTVINAAGGIPLELFSYNASTGFFDHISTMYDLANFGTDSNTTDPFYRSATVTLVFTDPTEASNAAADQITILNQLVKDYNQGAADFNGTVDTPILGV